MKRLADKKLAIWQIMLLSFVSTCGMLSIMLLKYGVCFETNDDRIFSEIFSGVLTGQPNAYGIYINYLLGRLISALFCLTRSVQWYGLFLISCFAAIYTGFLIVILQKCRNFYEQIIFWLLGCLLIAANVYIFAVIQFTTVAGALAVAGYAWLILDKESTRKYVVFGGFEFFAVLLRQDSMLMTQPVGISVVIAFLVIRFWEKRQQFGTCLKEVGKCFGTLICVILLAYIGNHLLGDYSSVEWKAYKAYNDQNVELADYYGYPEYEQAKEILEKYDVTAAEYKALQRYLVLDNKFEPGFMEEISDLAKANYEQEHAFSVIRIMKRLITYPKYDECYGYEIAVLVLYIAVTFLILLSGQIKYLLSVIALGGSKNVVFAYLIYKGRLPHRVVNVLWFAELLLLAVIGVYVYWHASQKPYNKKIISGIVLGIACTFLYTANTGADIAQNKNDGKIYYAECMKQLFDYCAESKEGVLLLDDVTTYYTGHVLDTWHYQNRISLVTGGWFSNSPTMDEAVKTYLDEHGEGLKCITFSEKMNVDNSYVLEFFEEKYGKKPEMVDTFDIEELGLSYAVYQLY